MYLQKKLLTYTVTNIVQIPGGIESSLENKFTYSNIDNSLPNTIRALLIKINALNLFLNLPLLMFPINNETTHY